MPRYEPLDAGVSIEASGSDLIAFQWQTSRIRADFSILGDDTHVLRVTFDRPRIVRLLDEMPLSTEEDDTPNEGMIPEHFAYRLDGAADCSKDRSSNSSARLYSAFKAASSCH